ncbi:hypothetical protein M408DRAFT_328615, partial [Serendipita vermifera MAFF 305830]
MSSPRATPAPYFTPPQPPQVNYHKKAQDFELPKCVKLSLAADVQQANAIAIVMALFAGALISLAQIVAGAGNGDDTSSLSWGALRVSLYAAIMLNLGGAFLSLICIKMCSDLPLAAQQRLLREGCANSTTPLSKLARDETLEQEILGDHFYLLTTMGMSPWYRLVDQLSTYVLIAACVCTFIALTFWVFLS